ncbi:hypothetical protein X769_13940 [Mesorhizobium sp. LSJC268A00]|nr:hypothetical protein X769_13940 [Mesorhizobium sp. LSJC268A00]
MFADPIKASSFERLHEQAGQKTAPDQCARTTNYLLQYGSHPQRTSLLERLQAAVLFKSVSSRSAVIAPKAAIVGNFGALGLEH